MGYVNDTDICQFIPPSLIQKSAGTWTPTVISNLVSDVRTAADAAFTLVVPLNLPGSSLGLQGAKIESVKVWYKIGTAAADDFATVEIDKATLGDNGDASSGAEITTSIDEDNDTAAERKTVDEHTMLVTLETPVFIEDDVAYYLVMVVDAAATTVFTLYGAQVNYTLRL